MFPYLYPLDCDLILLDPISAVSPNHGCGGSYESCRGEGQLGQTKPTLSDPGLGRDILVERGYGEGTGWIRPKTSHIT